MELQYRNDEIPEHINQNEGDIWEMTIHGIGNTGSEAEIALALTRFVSDVQSYDQHVTLATASCVRLGCDKKAGEGETPAKDPPKKLSVVVNGCYVRDVDDVLTYETVVSYAHMYNNPSVMCHWPDGGGNQILLPGCHVNVVDGMQFAVSSTGGA